MRRASRSFIEAALQPELPLALAITAVRRRRGEGSSEKQGLNFQKTLRDSGISLTTDVKSLHPEAPGWNRRLTD